MKHSREKITLSTAITVLFVVLMILLGVLGFIYKMSR